jgi:energy-coupling factor transport system permease protein
LSDAHPAIAGADSDNSAGGARGAAAGRAVDAWLQGSPWWLDPRTKIAVLLVTNAVSMNMAGSALSWVARGLAMLLAASLWLSVGRVRTAVVSVVSFGAAVGLLQWARLLPGQWALVGGVGTLVVMFMPIVAMATYAVRTTQVSELVAALERLRLPAALVIPLSVVLRFLPTIGEEYASIADAMRMRGISFRGRVRNPIALLEYRMVPLLISLVRIGDELTAAALTRGLGGSRQRTHVCRSGFGRRDLLVGLAALVPLGVLVAGTVAS